MANNFKRMQLIAGLITESEYRESMSEAENKLSLEEKLKGWVEFNAGGYVDTSDMEDEDKDKFERELNTLLQNTLRKLDSDPSLKDKILKNFVNNSLDIVAKYSMGNYGDSTSFSPEEYKEGFYEFISKDDPISSFYDMNESKLNENKIGALLNTVADDWGEDSDLYSDLEDSLAGWTDRNGQLTPKGKISIKNLLSNWDLLDDYGHFLDDEEMNEGDTDYDRAKDAKRLGKKGEKDIYGAGVEKGEEIEKKKMKMSELKAAIKELAEMDGAAVTNADYDPVAESVWSVLPARIPEFIQKIKDIKDEYHAVVGSDDVYDGLDHAISAAEELMNSKLSEAKKDEKVKSDKFTIGTDKSNPLHPSFFVYNTETGEKSKVFKTKKEAEELMNSKLNEAKKDKDEEIDDSETIDTPKGDEEITADVTTTDVDPDVKAVQDALTQAQAAAEKLGDEKLTDQIGNTITFFTRSHIVEKPGVTAESNIKERISKLVKSL